MIDLLDRPRKNAPLYQWYTSSTLNNLVCHWWWALQHLVLRVTDNLYALTPNESVKK